MYAHICNSIEGWKIYVKNIFRPLKLIFVNYVLTVSFYEFQNFLIYYCGVV